MKRTNLSKRSSKGSKCLQSPIVAITCLQITCLLVKDNFVEFVKDFYKIVIKYLFGCFNNFPTKKLLFTTIQRFASEPNSLTYSMEI